MFLNDLKTNLTFPPFFRFRVLETTCENIYLILKYFFVFVSFDQK